jgi:hypothetical protein
MKKLEIFIQPTIADSCLRTLPGPVLKFILTFMYPVYYVIGLLSFLSHFNLLYIVAFTFIILSCECVFIFLTDVIDYQFFVVD